MDTASIARKVVAKLGNGAGMGEGPPGAAAAGAGNGAAADAEKAPKGIGVGHTAAAERFIDGIKGSKPNEVASALKDFIRLVLAEGDDD